MKKLLKEEKIVSVPENILINFVIITFLFLSNLSAQVPINGFCRYREFPVKPNFTNVFGVDYTIDGFRDLIVYKSNENKYLTLTADNKSNFGKMNEKYSPYVISDLHPMINENTGRSYLILSRKNRQVGIASFSKNGSIAWKSKIKFDGFPTKIDVGDVDGDGKRVGLVSGSSLDGLFIVRENKNTFKETKIAKGKTFAYSSFIDLDYDKFSDIVAFDAQTNSFIFYNNNHYGGFSESRSIGMKGELSEFKTADFNSDGFTDLIYIRNNRLEVLLGDSVSSFQKKIVLDTPVKPDRYVIQDFNGDGFNDVAFINRQSGELYISYAKGTNLFYQPILYMRKNNLVDLAAYVDRGGKKLVALGSDGKVYLINTVKLNDDNFSVSLGLKPGAVATFDFLNDKFKDICYINEGEPSLNLLISERRNLFRTFYSIPVSTAFHEIEINDLRGREKTFFLYRKGERTVEAIRVNLDNFSYAKRIFYTDGSIEDFKLAADRLQDRETIYLLEKKNQQLLMQNCEFRDFKYFPLGSDFIEDNVSVAGLSLSVYREIYFWRSAENEIDLKKYVFDKKVIGKDNLVSKRLTPSGNVKLALVCSNENLGRFKPAAAIISAREENDLYLIYKNQVSRYPLKFQAGENARLKYYLDQYDNKMIFCYSDNLGKLQSVLIDPQQQLSVQKNLSESGKINDYLIEDLSYKRTYFIYSNNYENTITFQKF